jgi:hypothetical protein
MNFNTIGFLEFLVVATWLLLPLAGLFGMAWGVYKLLTRQRRLEARLRALEERSTR